MFHFYIGQNWVNEMVNFFENVLFLLLFFFWENEEQRKPWEKTLTCVKYGLLSIKYEDSEDNDARDYANK